MKKTQFVQKNTHPNYVFFKKIPRENWGQRAIQNHFRDQPRQGVPANMALTLKPTLTLIGPAAGLRFSRHGDGALSALLGPHAIWCLVSLAPKSHQQRLVRGRGACNNFQGGGY